MKLLRPLTLALVLLQSAFTSAQLQVNNTTITPEELVNNVLLGGGVSAFNITFNNTAPNALNPNVQAGQFNNGNVTNVGITSGVILGSGNVQLAIGPQTGPETNNTGVVNVTGDPDLVQIMGSGAQNCAILEFDFVPQGNEITFNYVFGSNEYNQYVFSNFNDGFGFFLSGPGIAGPFSNNAANLAVLPGTNTPVTINNVNQGQGGCPAPNGCTNCQYFVDNCGGQTINYNGFTTVLTATAEVICGETYHIKLAIADASDTILDSGVFLEAGSFSSNDVFIEAEIPNALPNFPVLTLLESCIDGLITIWRPNTAEADTVFLVIGGTATPGEDYIELPEFVIFEPGQETITLEVTTLYDGIAEGTETITVSYTYTNGCDEEVTISIELFILDYFFPTLDLGPDLLLCNEETAVLSAVPDNGFAPFTYTWSSGQSTAQITVGQLPGTETYTVNVSDYCGNEADDTITVIVPDQNIINWEFIQVNAPPGFPENTLLEGCVDGIIAFTRDDNTGTDVIQLNFGGSATMGSDYENIPNQITFGPGDEVITININTILDNNQEGTETIVITYVYIDGCDIEYTETLSLNLLNYNMPQILVDTDLFLCEGQSTNISGLPAGGYPPFSYSWSTGDDTVGITVVGGEIDSVFVTSFDYCGNDASAAFGISIPEPLVAPQNADLCFGGSIGLQPTGGETPYIFEYPSDSLSLLSGEFIPEYTGTYTITYIDQCGVSVSSQLTVIICETNIPNIFSPNNDGINDTFIIQGTQGFPNSRFEVYNRWGTLVYESDNYRNNWRGEDLAEGVYFYIYHRDDGEKFNGYIHLVRTTRP